MHITEKWVSLPQDGILRYVGVLERLAPASDAIAGMFARLRNGEQGVNMGDLSNVIGQIAVVYRFMTTTNVSAVVPNAPEAAVVFDVYQELVRVYNQAMYEAGYEVASDERWEQIEHLERRLYEIQEQQERPYSMATHAPMPGHF